MRDKLIESLKLMAHDLSNIEAGQDLNVLLEKTKVIYEKLVILDYLTKNIDLLEGEEKLHPSSGDHEIVVAPEPEKEATVEEFSESNETKDEKETLTTSDQIEIEEEHKSEETGYYEAMLQSYQEATEIQKQFSAASVSQTAITLFIAKTKVNGFNNYPKE